MEGSVMSSAGEAMPAGPPRSPSWRKSSHSNPSGECVELSRLTDLHIGVRCSQHPDGCTLVLSYDVVIEFIQRVKNGDFDEIAR
jgi:hypothetical protein